MSDELKNDDELEKEFSELLEAHLPGAKKPRRGELLAATVAAILDDTVLVNYGAKEEAPIALSEFTTARGEIIVKVGDAVRVVLLGWDSEGVAELSFRQARAAESARMLEDAFARGVPVRGTIAKVVKGGVIVDVGVEAFMPGSQVDVVPVPDLQATVGQEIEAYVLEYDASKRRGVLSRRKLLAERRDKGRQAALADLVPGQTVKGRVRDVLDFGVFIQLGDVEALIPRSELSYDRGVVPSEVVSAGQEIEAKILEVNTETGRVTLSRKRLGEDPWTTIRAHYPVGTTVSGKVVTVQSFGAFVQLQEGITGLIHAKDISWKSGAKTAEEHFRIGDVVTCQVTEIDEAKKRLALSLKHLARDPWLDVAEKFAVGTRHKAVVGNLRPFGAFVRLDDYTEALLHVGDLTWKKRPAHPSDVVKEGETIEVVVLKIDAESRRISVGLKQVTSSPFADFIAKNPVGTLVTGKVTRFAPFGAFVELAPDVEGLVHVSEIAEQRVEAPERALKMGEEIQAKVVSVDADKQKIGLSRKQAIMDQERDNIRQYTQSEKKKELGGAFGGALSEALSKARNTRR